MPFSSFVRAGRHEPCPGGLNGSVEALMAFIFV
jgi:hypothetical protein